MEDTYGLSREPCADDRDLDDDSCDDVGQVDNSGYIICENIANNDLTAHLASSGLAGVAAASALATPRKHNRSYAFEENPAMRRRQASRLLRKLQQLIEEFNVRVGQQAVVFVCSPRTANYGASGCNDPRSMSGSRGMSLQNTTNDSLMGSCVSLNSSHTTISHGDGSSIIYKVYGSTPLDSVLKNLKPLIVSELENALENFRDTHLVGYSSISFSGVQPDSLPPLLVDGIPTTLDKMTQAQLRAFIPTMLKFSTGKGKPGWGNVNCMPPWWPEDVPWANVRSDVRSEAEKARVSWTAALKKVVRQCYMYYGRGDLLEDPIGGMLCDGTQPGVEHQMMHHSDSGLLGIDESSLHHHHGLNICTDDGTIDDSCDHQNALLHHQQQAASNHHMFLTSTGLVSGTSRSQNSILHHPQLTNNRMELRCVTATHDGLLNNCDTSDAMAHAVYSLSTVAPHHMHDSSTIDAGSVVNNTHSAHRYHSISPYAIKTEDDGSISFYQYATSDVPDLTNGNRSVDRVVDVSNITTGQQNDCLVDPSRSQQDSDEKPNTMSHMNRSSMTANNLDHLTGRIQTNHDNPELSSGGVVSLPAGTVVQLGSDNSTAYIQFVTCVSNDVGSDHNNLIGNNSTSRSIHSPVTSTSSYIERKPKNC